MYWQAIVGENTICAQPIGNYPEDQWRPRHQGGVNIAFADGHVKWQRPDRFISDPCQWMVHPQFHPRGGTCPG
ncbi:MAG: hypothetical protein NZT92_00490 [Abditibacteriales bacterium]|nr:hypothetical protein [Abditibacteriales bacterium]